MKKQHFLKLDGFKDKWVKTYPLAIQSWRKNWHELAVMFKYSPEIRKIIYTTNAIENFNRLALSPNTPDREAAQNEIYKWEFKLKEN